MSISSLAMVQLTWPSELSCHDSQLAKLTVNEKQVKIFFAYERIAMSCYKSAPILYQLTLYIIVVIGISINVIYLFVYWLIATDAQSSETCTFYDTQLRNDMYRLQLPA